MCPGSSRDVATCFRDETGKHYLVIDGPRLLREEVVVQLASTTVNDTPYDAAPDTAGLLRPTCYAARRGTRSAAT